MWILVNFEKKSLRGDFYHSFCTSWNRTTTIAWISKGCPKINAKFELNKKIISFFKRLFFIESESTEDSVIYRPLASTVSIDKLDVRPSLLFSRTDSIVSFK